MEIDNNMEAGTGSISKGSNTQSKIERFHKLINTDPLLKLGDKAVLQYLSWLGLVGETVLLFASLLCGWKMLRPGIRSQDMVHTLFILISLLWALRKVLSFRDRIRNFQNELLSQEKAIFVTGHDMTEGDLETWHKDFWARVANGLYV